MNKETIPGAPERPIWSVARTERAACLLAELAAAAGFPTKSSASLEDALVHAPQLVIVDPGGWESTCRRALESYHERPSCPPAVLLIGPEANLAQDCGPAFARIPTPVLPVALGQQIRRAIPARERFAAVWPRAVQEFSEPDLAQTRSRLESHAGMEVRAERQRAFVEAVRSRMVGRLVPSVREYAEMLGGDPAGLAEVRRLASKLAVGETYFWRYSGQFLALQQVLLPSLAAGQEGRSFRFWSAGCATGEEAYSIAIAALETLGSEAEVEVVATDLHPEFLARAEVGSYRRRALRNLPSELARRYLEITGTGGMIRPEVKRRVRFAALNLGGREVVEWVRRNGPFDAIFCRNTLIYFSRRAADQLIRAFEQGLVAGGGLFMGAAEGLRSRRRGLVPVRAMGSFFYCKTEPTALLPRCSGEHDGSNEAAVPRIAARYEAALALLDVEDFPGAEQIFREILERRPDDSRGHTGLAFILANAGREGEAAECLLRACRTGPALAETRYLLGLLAERRGEELEAVRRYRETLDVDPDFFMAHLNRAWIYGRTGRRNQFLEEMGAALGILERRPRVSRWLTGGMEWESLVGLAADALGVGQGAA